MGESRSVTPRGLPERAGAEPADLPTKQVDGLLTGGGHGTLFWQGWLPPESPTGVLMICHGLGEHSGRYQTVVDTLVPDGWAIYAVDLRGHGRSAGLRTHVDRYPDLLDDLDTLRTLVTERHPDLPQFLLGHSMGGQVALAYALYRRPLLAGLVLSAPLLAMNTVSPATVAVLRRVARLAPRLRPAGIDPTKVSKDPDVVADMQADPLVWHGNPTLGLSAALFNRCGPLLERARELQVPLLTQHGLADEITDPIGTARLAAIEGPAEKTALWYPGLWHEIYHEPERARPLADLRDWLDAHRTLA